MILMQQVCQKNNKKKKKCQKLDRKILTDFIIANLSSAILMPAVD